MYPQFRMKFEGFARAFDILSLSGGMYTIRPRRNEAQDGILSLNVLSNERVIKSTAISGIRCSILLLNCRFVWKVLDFY
jgi:hypothetical protein